MGRFVSILLLAAVAGAVTLTATASKQAPSTTTGTVVGVVSGDTLLVRLPAVKAKPQKLKKGQKAKPVKPAPLLRARILGVQAPAGSDCYAQQSAEQTKALTLGKAVTLAGDAAHGYYVSLAGTDDVGRVLVGTGAAQIDSAAGAFSRVETYVPLQDSAVEGRQGMWSACAADISVAMTGADQAFVGQDIKYSVVISNAGPLVASSVELQVRPGNYRETLVSVATPSGTCTPKVWMATCAINGIASGGTATVTVVLRGSDFGALSARADASLVGCVSAQCGSSPLIDPNNQNDHAAVVTILPGGGYVKACEPSYPTVCIPLTPPDLDCADFLPLKAFKVDYTLANPDPHHLDGNHDGIACEGEDY
jgi:endonuclease YncB( thermonuclease family)